MSKSAFETRATAWLRDRREVTLAPPDANASAGAHRFGEQKMPSDATQWGFRGLLLVAISAVLSLVASRPGIGLLTERSVSWAAIGALLFGLGSLVVAWRRRIPSRPICVVFVSTGKAREKTQAEAVESARAIDFAGEVWMMSDATWAPAALAAAGARVRCFEPRGREFAEVTPTRSSPRREAPC